MTKTVPTQIRINKDVKMRANKLFSGLGLDMSSAVNIFLNQCIINKGLPFVITIKKNDNLDRIISEARRIHNSDNIKGFHDGDDLLKDMRYDE